MQDGVGSEQAAIFVVSEGGGMTRMVAATCPVRTRSIIVVACRPGIARAADQPSGWRNAGFDAYMRMQDAGWGEERHLDSLAPSIADDPKSRTSRHGF